VKEMTNPERREKISKELDELINLVAGHFKRQFSREEDRKILRCKALTALEALMPQVMSEEEIYKIVYAVERKTCASEECEITCPAYKENEEYPCGARQRSRELAKSLTIAKPVMTKEEVEKVLRKYGAKVGNKLPDLEVQSIREDLASKLCIGKGEK
jgi:hypothetical protein